MASNPMEFGSEIKLAAYSRLVEESAGRAGRRSATGDFGVPSYGQGGPYMGPTYNAGAAQPQLEVSNVL